MKVTAVIQARMQSTRLSAKVLLPLPKPNGKIVLEHIVNQMKKSKQINAIVIAIPQEKTDDILFENVQKLDGVAGVIRGSEENVLQRFLGAADLFLSEYIVRLTGDNPLIDASVVDEAILFIKKNSSADYVYTTGLPLGLNIEVVKVSALKTCAELSDLTEADKEHVTYGIRSRTQLFTTADLDLKDWWNDSLPARFTLDTPEDYIFLSAVVYAMDLNNYPHDIVHLKKLLHETPWMIDINKHVQQKQPAFKQSEHYK
jgi:spore coat polysaccharide biosynthesis protein SpsF